MHGVAFHVKKRHILQNCKENASQHHSEVLRHLWTDKCKYLSYTRDKNNKIMAILDVKQQRNANTRGENAFLRYGIPQNTVILQLRVTWLKFCTNVYWTPG